jgi:hypothetical protein
MCKRYAVSSDAYYLIRKLIRLKGVFCAAMIWNAVTHASRVSDSTQ